MSMLDEARKQINEIDAQMAELFEQRMHAVEDVIAYKQEHQMPVLDSGREKAVIERNHHRQPGAGRIQYVRLPGRSD